MIHLRMSMRGEDDLQAAYNNLFEEFTKLKKLNEKTLKKLKEIELEKNWMILMLGVIL
jgi:hypothetical protein